MTDEIETASIDAKKSQINAKRKLLEDAPLVRGGVTYTGTTQERQAIKEALDYAEAAGVTAFAEWKDSVGAFHPNHPASEVRSALLEIAARRAALIAREAQLHAELSEIKRRAMLATTDADHLDPAATQAAVQAVPWW